MNGEWHDPLLGRHVLLGLACGSIAFCLNNALRILGGPRPIGFERTSLSSPGRIASQILPVSIGSLQFAFWMIFLLLVADVLLRNRWAAAIALGVVFGAITPFAPWDHHIVAAVGWLVIGFGMGVFFLRYGVLAALAFSWVFTMANFPLTLHASACYFTASAAMIATCLGIGLWAMRTALAGQPLFGPE